MHLSRRALPTVLAFAATAFCWQTGASAQSAPAAPAPEATQPAPLETSDTIRLTDEQRMRLLDSNTTDSAAAARGEMTGSQRAALRIRGEVGAAVGSNGLRSIYGVAEIPLGETARATVMFENTRYGPRR